MKVYVHALTGAPRSRVAVRRHRIEFLDLGTVHAAVERLEVPPLMSVEALAAQHEIVQRIAAVTDAILPARFGSHCDLSELRRIVELRSAELGEALELVRGREQMTTRFARGLVAAAAPSPAPRAQSGAAYLRARRDAETARLPPHLEHIREAVKDIALAERIHAGDDRIGPAVYHLVERDREKAYRRALAPLRRRLGAPFRVSGPWPPFAFAPELL